MSNLTPAQRGIQTVRDLLGKVDLNAALPDPRLTAERFQRIVLTTLQRTPKVAQTDPRSVLACVVESAQLGLVPDGLTGEAYLVPFKNTCTLIVGYRGLLKLARNSGEIASIYAFPVYEGDRFKHYLGLKPNIVHEPNLDTPEREEPGNMTYVYAVALFKDGTTQFEVMSRREVMRIKSRSRSGSNGPWVSDFVEMAKKTVLRRLCKMLPVSTQMMRAVAVDEAQERGDAIPAAAEVIVEQEPKASPLKALTDQLQQDAGTEPEQGDVEDEDADWPPLNGETQQQEQPAEEPRPDRRQRKTVLASLTEGVRAIGKDAAWEIRKGLGIEDDVDVRDESFPIDKLRELDRAIEDAELRKALDSTDQPPV